MDTKVVAQYRKNRTIGMRASSALSCAKNAHKVPSYEWEYARSQNGFKEFTTKQDGFTIHVIAQYDNSGDSFFLDGEFISKYQDGCIPHPEAHKNNGSRRNDVMPYFMPNVTYADHYSALRYDHGKHEAHTLARKYVLESLKRALQCGNHWSPLDIFAYVSREGVKLAYHCVGGFATDYSDEDLSFAAEDIIYEAMAEAKDKLAALCKTTEPCNCHAE